MKSVKEIDKKMDELARELVQTTGSKAHRIRGEINRLNWVLE